MPLFQSIGETLGLVPASTHKIKKSSSIPSKSRNNSSLASRLEAQRMSPNTRTQEWLANSSPEKKAVSFTSNPSVLGVKDGRIVKHAHTPKSSLKSKSKYSVIKSESSSSSRVGTKPAVKRKSGLWDILMSIRFKSNDKGTPKSDTPIVKSDSESVMEGSTLVEEVIDSIEDDSDLDGPSNFEGQTLLTQDKNGDLKVQDDDGGIQNDNEADFSDFTDEEYFLFHKLNARGYEPILHIDWAMDFCMLPGNLFTRDRSEAYINAVKAPEYHAQKALYNLFEVGMRARDALVTGIAPEKIIRRYLNEYFNWTMHDAKLKKVPHIPVLTITVAHQGEPITSVVNRCTDRLYEFGRQYRNAWLIEESDDEGEEGLGVSIPQYKHRLPTVYGIIVKSTAVGFITYDSSVPGKTVRNLGVWNLAKHGQDVWHAFAFAIFMICARNHLLELERDGMLGEEIGEESDDPDA